MGKGQMGQQYCLGSVVGPWYGMQHAPSHLALAAREAGVAAIQAEQRKTEMYAHLSASHHFVAFAIETSGVFGPEVLSLLEDESEQRLVSHSPFSSVSKGFQ